MSFVKNLGSASRLTLLAATIASLVACSESTAPRATGPDGETPNPVLSLPGLTPSSVLRFRRGAPSLESARVSFYAKKGEARSISMYFKTASGGRGGEYARLVVPAGALSKRPNGTAIAWGDSVLITITAPEPSLLMLKMEPEGLKFETLSPARLTMKYGEADRDLNRDGTINLFDKLLELRLAIWRQPSLLDLFGPIFSLLDQSAASISADLRGFSQYIIAY